MGLTTEQKLTLCVYVMIHIFNPRINMAIKKL